MEGLMGPRHHQSSASRSLFLQVKPDFFGGMQPCDQDTHGPLQISHVDPSNRH